MKRVLPFVLLVGSVLLVAPLVVAQSYTLTDLGTLSGGEAEALAINNSGQIVGWASVQTDGDAQEDAFLWTAQGGMQDVFSNANFAAIDNAGEAAGSSITSALIWTETGGIVDLGFLNGGSVSGANAINDLGDVVGSSAFSNSNRFEHAFVWNSARGMQDIGTLGGNNSWALGINNHRQVVGYSSLPGDNASHAFLWTSAGGMRDLGTLGGSVSSAQAINDSGAIVGGSRLPGDTMSHAFVWTESKGMQDLGTLGGSNSIAVAINNSGEVVGNSDTHKTSKVGVFLWRSGKGMENLTKQISASSGWWVTFAGGINKIGQIAATGFSPDDPNDFRAVLLKPTKPPAD
jgi:probable HAF family extracellular repeat protein